MENVCAGKLVYGISQNKVTVTTKTAKRIAKSQQDARARSKEKSKNYRKRPRPMTVRNRLNDMNPYL